MSSAHNSLQMRLVGLFRDMGLRPDDVVPSEAMLASRLAASRQAIRESLRALEALGVVDAHQGARRRLRGFDPSTFGRQLGLTTLPTLENLQELLEIRRILESAFLPAAIVALDASTLAEMRALTDAMHEAAHRGQPFLDEDESFHALMYKRLGNLTLSGMLGAFWQFFKTGSQEVTTGEHLQHTAAMHALIVDALESGDADLAVHRLDAHFFDVRDRLRRQRTGERRPLTSSAS